MKDHRPEYTVRIVGSGGEKRIEMELAQMADRGWRLVSTAAAHTGGVSVTVYLFFERATESAVGSPATSPR